MNIERTIVHVDMDAFYASVEQRDFPGYRDRPVIVGADPKGGKGRGVVAACSYEARRFGIHSAMPISKAYRRCPEAVFLRPRMDKYLKESRRIFTILERFTPDIEPVSIDEAFLDITDSFHLFGSAADTCRLIKATIRKETGLAASLGMAPNKMTAKIASDLDKPDGLVIVDRKGLLVFLHTLPVTKLWGVGKKTQILFRDYGIRTIGDLARQDQKTFVKTFGKAGEHAWKLANGIDPRMVTTEREAKSVGHEHTFPEDVRDKGMVLDTLMRLSESVSRRLRKAGLKGRTITLKIRFSDFKTHTKAASLPEATNFVEDIYRQAAARAAEFDLDRRLVRLVGVSVSHFERKPPQPTLFQADAPDKDKREQLHKALDRIKDRFGEGAIRHRISGED
jgi:DNA polymerase-4